MWDRLENNRTKSFLLIIIGVFVILIGRLAWLQLLQGPQFKMLAEENRIRQIAAHAPRGTMYDRNGAVIVSSRPSFAISIIPNEYTNPAEVTPFLATLTRLSAEQITKMLADSKDYPYTPLRVKRDVDEVTVTQIQERRSSLPGVIIEAIPVRHYTYKQLAAHIFGYIGAINEEEFAKRKAQGYHPHDLVGKDGLERIWEDTLRGVEGGKQVEMNAAGEETRVVGEKAPIPGKGLVLTLDANLQKAAEEALAAQIETSKKIGEPAKGGAVVVLNVKTGGVLTMASLPAFDPNLFASEISSKDWNNLIANPNNPLANRAIQSAYPPASVFKIVTAAAALDGGFTTPTEVFEDKGVYMLGNWPFYGWEPKGLGRLTIVDALVWSSDPFFYEMGNRMGVDTLASYALTFGFGKLSEIKLIGEEHGNVPTEEWKQKTFGEQWYPGETLIAAIGQGYYLVTPIQHALAFMAVANGGIVYRPMLVDKIVSPDGATLEKFEPEVLRTVYLKPEIWDTIRQGLVGVTTKGTASKVFAGFPKTVAGKTGSAETGRRATHSWFACYAPAENPEVVVAAFVEDGGEGSVAAAPVVRKVLDAYFGIPSTEPPVIPQGKTD
ncbi:penicillin-binding protein 2 [Sporomusa sp.]|uniref:penicillin-binding protein 2 n=1 Tax=Sporomusa sp. TaxID=2078658 RepID=UPI002CDAF5A8|nr:penicillin-binding protein 2 [Sporomusa sp.]HWR43473.1 penicillin-binding protein 2 [Sporomusa sp.]